MNQLKVEKIKRRMNASRGGDLLDLRTIATVSKNGNNGAALRIPQLFREKLNWKPGETRVYLTLSEDGKVIVEPIEKAQPAKAS